MIRATSCNAFLTAFIQEKPSVARAASSQFASLVTENVLPAAACETQ